MGMQEELAEPVETTTAVEAMAVEAGLKGVSRAVEYATVTRAETDGATHIKTLI